MVDGSYDAEPDDPLGFSRSFDRLYTRLAPLYDVAVKLLPLWKTWLRRVLPHLRGPRVLEISFGTGYLLCRYASRFDTHAIDLNEAMVRTARANLARAGVSARLCRGRVEALPYPDRSFDTIVNTMAFSGYPNARRALAEMHRILRPGGQIVLIDINHPGDGNRYGEWATRLARRSGDLIRDLPALFRDFGFAVSDEEIGGFGSVHLYVALRPL